MAVERETGFGELLRRYRVAVGLTQEELAERAGISARAVSDLERGVNRAPRSDTLQLLVAALDLPDEDRRRWEVARRRLATRVAAPSRARPPAKGNLPLAVSGVIGRERERAALAGLLAEPDVRLVTVTGPGGIGKTTLALVVAHERRERFPDGCYVVPLAQIREPLLVPAAIAAALGMGHSASQDPALALAEALREQRVLLLLDNFEHVLDAAPMLGRLLRDCAGLTLLVTSRARLRLSGEREFQVLPLALPGPDERDPEAIARSPAVALFVERACAVKADFALTDGNATAVAAICRRLDALPLAVELAAAWLKLLPPAALLSRLEQRRLLLVGGAADLPERLQTLRSTIAWSFDFLRPEEQRVFQRLAVFRGGCRLETAEAVAGDGIGGDLLAVLGALIDKSLLVQTEEPDGWPRFSMLETVQEFAEERLEASDEAGAVWQRFVDCQVALVERAERESTGPEQRVLLRQLTAEYPNLRAALEYATSRGDPEDGCRLAGALWRYWYARGHYTEGAYWQQRALAHSADSRSPARAKTCLGAGILAQARGELGRARAALSEAEAVYGEQGLPADAALATAHLGLVARDEGDEPLAVELLERSLAALDANGARWGAALVRNHLGSLASGSGDVKRAEALLEASRAGFRGLRDLWGVANATSNLGTLALRRGDVARAATLLDETLSLQEHLGDRRGVTITLAKLAQVTLSRDDLSRARGLCLESLSLHQEMHDDPGIAAALELLARVELELGRPEPAIRYSAAAGALRRAIGLALAPVEQPALDRVTARLHAAVDDERFDALWAAGESAPLAGLIDAALAEPPAD